MKAVRIVIVGAGNRAWVYSSFALSNPNKMVVVGVVDPNPNRVERFKERFKIEDEHCYSHLDEFLKVEPFADAVFNCTMDDIHVQTSMPLLEKGYDLLLEKPYALNKTDAILLADKAESLNRKVMICHVLRYAPFYQNIKQKVLSQEIGKIISLQTTEHVSFHHMAVSYVRGKWRNSDTCQSSMLLAKCCHDMDLIMWLNNDTEPLKISSFGGLHFFTEKNAPQNSGTRCLTDCPVESTCVYSAQKHYIDRPTRWHQYVWTCLEENETITIEEKIHSLKTDNPYGKCVFKNDNNVVDRQTVTTEFVNGSISNHTMLGGASTSQRYIHIVGTKGEIRGVFEDNLFTVKTINPTTTTDFNEEIVDLNVDDSMDMVGAYGGHGGGDLRWVADFINYLTDQKTSQSLTSVQDSLNSHLAVFLADQALASDTVTYF